MTLPRLHCITFDGAPLGFEEQARAFLTGGAKLVQLRAKTLEADLIAEIASRLMPQFREKKAQLIINDHLDIALKTGAGLHMGRSDGDPVEARNALGGKVLLGQTVNCVEEARRVRKQAVASYAGVGPWRFTTTKAGLSGVLDFETMTEIIAILNPIPVVLIGGIKQDDLPEIFKTGAHGCAVSSALANYPNPALLTASFLATMKDYI